MGDALVAPEGGPRHAVPDLVERRPEVVRRLLACRVSPHTLQALLPGWELLITDACTSRLAVPQEPEAS